MKRTLGILSILLVLTVAALAQPSAVAQKPEHLSNKQLNALIATARTPAEHRRIAQYYDAKSRQYLAESQEHERIMESYEKNPIFSSSKFKISTIDHCKYLEDSLQKASVKMHELAVLQEEMAAAAEKK